MVSHRIFYAYCILLLAAASVALSEAPPTIGLRGPPSFSAIHKNDTCHAGALCVGPGQMYPLGRVPGVIWKSRFVVPELPVKFETASMTYYDYLNIFWRDNPKGGFMNQFVPQLMLGNPLANSTNAPDYKPIWIEMNSWHIGAQYFMGLCGESSDCKKWIPKAATGRLVAVEPGEVVETSFSLKEVTHCCKETQLVWTLHIGVVGGGPDRQSIVVSDRPFMGLLNSTFSWGESTYDNIYVGSCLENYNMQIPDNYPTRWQIDVAVVDAPGRDENFWHDWRLDHGPSCPWQPVSTLANAIDKKSQHVKWRAELQGNSTVSSLDLSRLLRH